MIFTIKTQDLIIRFPTINDAQMMADFVVKNKEHFKPFWPDIENNCFTKNYWACRFNFYQQDKTSGKELHFIIFHKDNLEQIIGDISFTNIDKGCFQATWVSYDLDLDFVGRGLMTQALTFAIEYMFSVYNLHRILAFVTPSNSRSLNLLKRLNFEQEGHLKHCLMINGQWQDQILLSLINLNWKK